jgi:hypothetical protein
LRSKWDDTLERNTHLERENKDLEFFLKEAHQRNSVLVE